MKILHDGVEIPSPWSVPPGTVLRNLSFVILDQRNEVFPFDKALFATARSNGQRQRQQQGGGGGGGGGVIMSWVPETMRGRLRRHDDTRLDDIVIPDRQAPKHASASRPLITPKRVRWTSC